jgi:hypothetical protein
VRGEDAAQGRKNSGFPVNESAVAIEGEYFKTVKVEHGKIIADAFDSKTRIPTSAARSAAEMGPMIVRFQNLLLDFQRL